jgi:hypothetical protein
MMKAIYWPEVANDEEKMQRDRRLQQTALSLILFGGVNFTNSLLWQMIVLQIKLSSHVIKMKNDYAF